MSVSLERKNNYKLDDQCQRAESNDNVDDGVFVHFTTFIFGVAGFGARVLR